MICTKCRRQMDHLPLLKRYECYYCDFTVHEKQNIKREQNTWHELLDSLKDIPMEDRPKLF